MADPNAPRAPFTPWDRRELPGLFDVDVARHNRPCRPPAIRAAVAGRERAVDAAGFRELLLSRHLGPEAIERSVGVVQRCEAILRQRRPGAAIKDATAGDVELVLQALARPGAFEPGDALAMARYWLFAGNRAALVAILERIDGADVPGRLSQELARTIGAERRGEVLAGLEPPSIDAAAQVKCAYMRTLMERLTRQVDEDALSAVLGANLHYQPAEAFAGERDRFLAAADVDAFLEDERGQYLTFLEGFRDEGTLYFTQPITDAVLEWVRSTPACGAGVRHGDRIRVTKIPYQADEYLRAEDDATRRRLACHCPWARATIGNQESGVPARLCECSAGFEAQRWNALFGRPVRVDVVRSALAGDLLCEFDVHVPEELVPAG